MQIKRNRQSLRLRANKAKKNNCKTLVCVLENPKKVENIATVIRNVNTLGVGKFYVIDENKILPDTWDKMRYNKQLNSISRSVIKWTYVKKFNCTEECIDYLKRNNFISIVTSSHLKGKKNIKLSQGKYTQPKLAVWFGNESNGISQEAIKSSHFCVQIEMFGIVESLNLGTSTGIILYTITQQRRNYNIKNKDKF